MRYEGPTLTTGGRWKLLATEYGAVMGVVEWDWRGIILYMWVAPEWESMGLATSLVAVAKTHRPDLIVGQSLRAPHTEEEK